MNEKMKKAEYLFSELSGIDEQIIAEALLVGRKRTSFTKRVVLILAAVLALVSVVISSFVIGSIMFGGREEEGAKPIHNSLDAALYEAEDSTRVMTYQNAEDIDFFDGVTKIVWDSGEDYRVIRLSNEEEKRSLEKAMSKSYSNAKASGGEDAAVSVWINYGDGRVVTPYLKDTEGNVGYGTLFDYEPEIVPTKDMSKFVNSLVSS